MNEATVEQKLMVVAKAFFDDGQGDPDYPFTDVNDQYEEMLNSYKEGNMHIGFINACYEMNS